MNLDHSYSGKEKIRDPIVRRQKIVWKGLGADDDLEDEDLCFKGYCYTSTGPDGSKNFADSYDCPLCPAIFETRVGLTNHTKLHGSQKSLICTLCDFACTNKKTMRLHRRIHGIAPLRNRRSNLDANKSTALALKKTKLKIADNKAQNMEKADADDILEHKATISISMRANETIYEDQRRTIGSLRSTRNNRQCKGTMSPPSAGRVQKMPRFKEDPEQEEQFIIIPSANGSILYNSGGLEMEEEEEIFINANRGMDSYYQEEVEIEPRFQPTMQQNQSSYFCEFCPFSTTSRQRMSPHLLGHSRQYGFVCSVCNFKHENKRWIEKHCQLHSGIPYVWPPVFVGETNSNEE